MQSRREGRMCGGLDASNGFEGSERERFHMGIREANRVRSRVRVLGEGEERRRERRRRGVDTRSDCGRERRGFHLQKPEREGLE